MDTLNSAFDGAQFAIDEIAQFVHLPRPNHKAVQHVDWLLESARRLRTGMTERGIDDFYERDVELLEYPLKELRKFFGGESSTLSDNTAAYIFAAFVRDQIEALQDFAQEIDADSAA